MWQIRCSGDSLWEIVGRDNPRLLHNISAQGSCDSLYLRLQIVQLDMAASMTVSGFPRFGACRPNLPIASHEIPWHP